MLTGLGPRPVFTFSGVHCTSDGEVIDLESLRVAADFLVDHGFAAAAEVLRQVAGGEAVTAPEA